MLFYSTKIQLQDKYQLYIRGLLQCVRYLAVITGHLRLSSTRKPATLKTAISAIRRSAITIDIILLHEDTTVRQRPVIIHVFLHSVRGRVEVVECRLGRSSVSGSRTISPPASTARGCLGLSSRRRAIRRLAPQQVQ